MVSLELLRTFCAIVQERSFRAAAARLNRSQPAVSQQIKNLEAELGLTLLERRGCRLTPFGERLYERARHILSETENLQRELVDLDRDQAHELRVGTSDTTALYVLPPVVRAFSKAMPYTRLVLTNRPSDAVAGQVLRGELDLGVVTLPVEHEELEERELFRQQLVLVTPKRHPLAARKRVEIHELASEPLLLLQAGTRTGALLRDHFRACGLDPQVVLDSGSFEVIKRYTAEGIGVSVLPRIVVTKDDRALATILVPGLPSVRIGAVWRRHGYQTRGARQFLELMTTRAS